MRDIKILLVLGLLLSTPAFAVEAFYGIQIQEITVNGVTYEVPVGNQERKSDIYYLKKAIKGDREALEMFLGGEESRVFYIGKEYPVWLLVDNKMQMKVLDLGDKNA